MERKGTLGAGLGTGLWLLGAGAAGAQVSSDIVEAMSGEYLVAPDDGMPGCRVRLTKNRAIGGYSAEADPACETALPKLANLSAWDMGDGLLNLINPERHVLMSAENEGAFWHTPGDNIPNYALAVAASGVDRAPFAPAIVGSWAMQRPDNKTICRVTFSDQPPEGGGDEAQGLALGKPCDPAVTRLKLVSWRVEDFRLVLYGTDGDSLSFEPAAAGAFVKSSNEGGKPLALVRE